MLGYLINLIFRWVSIRRWNNYPRIEEFVEDEHISLLLQVSYVVSKILNEKWQKIDLVYIYKNIFWGSFFTFIYSDINFEVKKYLKQKYYWTYEKLWEQIDWFFDKLKLPENLKSDWKQVYTTKINWKLFDTEKSLEDEIIIFVKNIVILFEIWTNITFYPHIYQPIYERVEKEIKVLNKKLWFWELDLVYDYTNFLVGLKFAYRWNRLNRTYPISVLSHLFLVFTFSYILGSLKNFDNEELEKICSISIMHDLPEALTGDIITPTKNAVPNFRKIIEEIENNLVEKKILSKFSNYKFKEELRDYILKPFESNLWKIAKWADNLSAMFEAKLENTEDFKKVYYDIKRYLWSVQDKELDYILKYWVDYFDDDVETKWKKFIWMIKE